MNIYEAIQHTRWKSAPTMTATVSQQSRSALTAAAVLSAIGLLINFPTLVWLVGMWNSNADYSHGFIVPVISGYLLYHRRSLLENLNPERHGTVAMVGGSVLILLALAFKSFGIYSSIPTLEAFALIPLLLGIVLLCCGFKSLYWAAPAILFLVFMIPLPSVVSGMLSSQLQRIATIAATYVLQTIGIPAVYNGNLITLSTETVGVAEACSGIRMLYSFFALSVGLCLVTDRPLWERIVLCFSAAGIAVAANLIRIVMTALAYEFGNAELADKIFHDFAGYLMMPIAMVFLWLEMLFLERVFVQDRSRIA